MARLTGGCLADRVVARSGVVPIAGTVTAYAATVAALEAWRFHLGGRFREVGGDFEYRDPGYAPGQV